MKKVDIVKRIVFALTSIYGFRNSSREKLNSPAFISHLRYTAGVLSRLADDIEFCNSND